MCGGEIVRLDFNTYSDAYMPPEMLHPATQIFKNHPELTKTFGFLSSIGAQHTLHTTEEIGASPIYAYVKGEHVRLCDTTLEGELLDNSSRLVKIYRDDGNLVLEFYEEERQFYEELDINGFSRCFNYFFSEQGTHIITDPYPLDGLRDETVFLKLYPSVSALLQRTEDICDHQFILYENGKLYSGSKIEREHLGTYFITTPNGEIFEIEFTLDEQGRSCGKLKLITQSNVNIENSRIELNILYLDPE
jgi:hypothetical protein